MLQQKSTPETTSYKSSQAGTEWKTDIFSEFKTSTTAVEYSTVEHCTFAHPYGSTVHTIKSCTPSGQLNHTSILPQSTVGIRIAHNIRNTEVNLTQSLPTSDTMQAMQHRSCSVTTKTSFINEWKKCILSLSLPIHSYGARLAP